MVVIVTGRFDIKPSGLKDAMCNKLVQYSPVCTVQSSQEFTVCTQFFGLKVGDQSKWPSLNEVCFWETDFMVCRHVWMNRAVVLRFCFLSLNDECPCYYYLLAKAKLDWITCERGNTEELYK